MMNVSQTHCHKDFLNVSQTHCHTDFTTPTTRTVHVYQACLVQGMTSLTDERGGMGDIEM